MAIEKVYVMNNTSIIQDEVVAHRLGLIPIKADPTDFDYMTEDGGPTDLNTLVFKLKKKCEFNPEAAADETDPAKKYINSFGKLEVIYRLSFALSYTKLLLSFFFFIIVYSGDLVWEPKGNQEEKFGDNPPRPVHDDIVIAKLRPGQEMEMELHCQKGIGREHAKWSPVATASYRILPEITILEPITGEDAEEFKKCFVDGVVEVVKVNGIKTAKVVNARKDTVSREVLRHEKFVDKVRLTRVRDHFIFNVETSGIIPAEQIFLSALDVFMDKIKDIQPLVDRVVSNEMN